MVWRLCVVLVLLASQADAATITRYVNTASSGGNGTTNATSGANAAYASCAAWTAAEATDLDTANNTMVVHFEGATADTASCELTGWTTSATDYIWMIVDIINRHPGFYSTAQYRLETTAAAAALQLDAGANHVRIEGLQFSATGTATDHATIYVLNDAATVDISVVDCVIANASTGDRQYGVLVHQDVAGGAVKIWNSLLYGFSSANSMAVLTYDGNSALSLYNNTFVNNFYGAYVSDAFGSPTVVAKNNLFYGNVAAAVGTFAAGTDYNAGNTASLGYTVTGGGNTHDRVDQTLLFLGSGDYHLSANDTGAKDVGVSDPGGGLFSDDIDGGTRSGAWDIGYDESGLAGPPPPGPSSPYVARVRRGRPPIPPPSPPETPSGIALNYHQDVGISGDPAVIFVEEFEDTIAAVQGRWSSDAANASSIDTDVPPNSPIGSHSIAMPSCVVGCSASTNFFKGFATRYSQLYVRFYIKETTAVHHSGVWMGGENIGGGGAPVFPDLHAGVQPCTTQAGPRQCSGGIAAWFWNSAEQSKPYGYFDNYSAFLNMRPDGTGTYWGDMLTNNAALQIADNTWTCVEHTVKMNTVNDTDGEMAMWLNGVQVSHLGKGFPNGTWNGGRFIQSSNGTPFEGIMWRDDAGWALNFVVMYNYDEVVQTIKYDHLVVATSYIGCMVP